MITDCDDSRDLESILRAAPTRIVDTVDAARGNSSSPMTNLRVHADKTVIAALAMLVFSACGDGGGGALVPGGEAGSGRVSTSDQSHPAGWAAPIASDGWHVDLVAGSAVTIVMCSTMPSSAFDPALQLDFRGERVADDDDSAGNLNARIVYTPLVSGTYDVFAMAHGGTAPAGGASYTLRVYEGAMFDVTCPAGTGP